MNQPPLTPDQQFSQFRCGMQAFAQFCETKVKDTSFDSWKHDGMHDPVVLPRCYAQIEQRLNFEAGSSATGFVVQLEIQITPNGKRRTAVYVRSKEFLKGKNTANVTFKFARFPKTESGKYVVRFARQNKAMTARLAKPKKQLPAWVLLVAGQVNTVEVGTAINPKLIHLLLLLADLAGQAADGKNVPRDPVRFFAPVV